MHSTKSSREIRTSEVYCSRSSRLMMSMRSKPEIRCRMKRRIRINRLMRS